MRLWRAIGVGVISGAVAWAIIYRLAVWWTREPQSTGGLGAVGEGEAAFEADVAALIAFASGFLWGIRRIRARKA